MSVTGLCQICESAQAQFACDRCGRMVCETHYDRELGLCTDCAKRVRGEERDAEREREDRRERGGPDDWGEPR